MYIGHTAGSLEAILILAGLGRARLLRNTDAAKIGLISWRGRDTKIRRARRISKAQKFKSHRPAAGKAGASVVGICG